MLFQLLRSCCVQRKLWFVSLCFGAKFQQNLNNAAAQLSGFYIPRFFTSPSKEESVYSVVIAEEKNPVTYH